MTGPHKQRVGRAGEAAAARWYEARGFAVVDRNWRCTTGEIDLVLRKGNVLVFCEVKTRSSNRFGSPQEAVTFTKQRRLRSLGMQWLGSHRDGRFWNLRFDVAAVSATTGDVLVIEDAF